MVEKTTFKVEDDFGYWNEELTDEQIQNDINKLQNNTPPPTQSLEQKQRSTQRRKVGTSMAARNLQHITDIRPVLINFARQHPYFYDKNKIWWSWNANKHSYEQIDETDLLISIDHLMGTSSISLRASAKAEILEGLKRVGRANKPIPAPLKWVQFQNKAFSINSKKVYDVTPEYFFTNPIPHPIGETSDTPILDDLFSQWVGEAHKQTLYELIAYCTYTAYPIQLIFCLWGNGRNGKSQFLKILDRFLGNDNTTTTELDTLVHSRFESFRLYKKLVCFIGETNFGRLTSSSLIKKLVGGDKIGFEMKNKNPFDDYNYAKLIIASNSLPDSDDTSDGFYRRWLILDFPHEFEDNGQEVWTTVPDKEYSALAKKVTEILPTLLSRGTFTNQGTIMERKQKYISVSNPLSLWVTEECTQDEHLYENYSKAYTAYVSYLQRNKKRKVKKKEFMSALEDEGFFVERTSKKVGEEYISANWINGFKLNVNCVNYVENGIPDITYRNRMEKSTYTTQFTQDFFVTDEEREKVLKVLGNKPYTHFNALQEHFPDSTRLSSILKKLSAEGLIFSQKPDLWSVLQ